MKKVIISIQGGNVIGPSGNTLSLRCSTSGYPKFMVTIGKRGKKYLRREVLVHKLKAFFLYGEELFGAGIEVRHLNGDKNDFRDNNIVLGTRRDNCMDIQPDNRRNHALKGSRKLRKFTFDEAEKIRKLSHRGISGQELAKLYGVRKSTISYIINKKTYAEP